MKQHNSNIIASVSTLLVAVAVFLLLWFLMIGYTPQQEDEGIMVSFGDSELGGGMEDGQLEALAASEPAQMEPAMSAPSDNDLMTQETDESLALRRQQEEKRRQEQAVREEQQRQKAERERLERERKAEEKRIAEENAKKQAAIDNANKMGALFGQTNNPEGSGGVGQSASSANKGNPLGHGMSGGNSWSLDGRSLKGALPQPENTFTQEGKVVINIIVDKEGNVVSASIGSGTTISDEHTRQLAKKAALKAKFNLVDKPDKAMGTITYNFKFK